MGILTRFPPALPRNRGMSTPCLNKTGRNNNSSQTRVLPPGFLFTTVLTHAHRVETVRVVNHGCIRTHPARRSRSHGGPRVVPTRSMLLTRRAWKIRASRLQYARCALIGMQINRRTPKRPGLVVRCELGQLVVRNGGGGRPRWVDSCPSVVELRFSG